MGIYSKTFANIKSLFDKEWFFTDYTHNQIMG